MHSSPAIPPQLLPLQGGFGSRVPFSLQQCALACQGARGCDMFTYNSVQQGCFLKTGQCPMRNNCQVRGQPRELSRLHRRRAGLLLLLVSDLPASGGLHVAPSMRVPPEQASRGCASGIICPQDPELICSSVNDLSQTIRVSCGTWSTWWRQASLPCTFFALRPLFVTNTVQRTQSTWWRQASLPCWLFARAWLDGAA